MPVRFEPPAPAGAETHGSALRVRDLWKLIVGFWTLYWVAYIVPDALAHWIDPALYKPLSPVRVFDEFTEAATWALLTPPLLWLGIRYPVGRANWYWRLPVHAGIVCGSAAAYGYLHYLTHEAITFMDHGPAGARRWGMIEVGAYLLDNQYRHDMFICVAILTGGLALRSYRDLQMQHVAAAQLRAQLSDARLQALRMQLHPHFLFNTLNTVSNLTVRDPREARRVLARLGALLRHVLESTDEQEVTLRDELAFARDYLDIVRARFTDRLRLEARIDPSLEGALVPTLILQPLLENAVEHGVSGTLGEARIGVEAERRGGSLVLRIEDDGPGLPSTGIEEGVGLGNTRARLAEMYGTAGILRVGGAAGGGVVVEVELPYRLAAAPVSPTAPAQAAAVG